MAKYKYYSYDQQLMIPVSLSKQVLPKTFEYTLNVLIDEEIDLSIFEYKYSIFRYSNSPTIPLYLNTNIQYSDIQILQQFNQYSKIFTQYSKSGNISIRTT